MKKRSLIFMAAFLISLAFSAQPVISQEKTKEEKEKELKLQQAIEEQKRALTDQKKALEEAKQQIDATARDAERSVARSTESLNFTRGGVRGSGYNVNDPYYVVSPGVEYSGTGTFFGRGGDSERTTWDFSKQVKESTFAKEYKFDVEKTVNTVVMNVMGDCKSGEIRVSIIMPGGKVYSDIVIDEFGNLNWRKSFTISETENKEKAGEWLFKIKATGATGFFKISLQTY